MDRSTRTGVIALLRTAVLPDGAVGVLIEVPPAAP
jgi:hypothetical protein